MRVFIFVICGILAVVDAGNVETREYFCSLPNPSKLSQSTCHLRFSDADDEFSAINDNGCFMHFDASHNENIELCPLQCHRHNHAELTMNLDEIPVECQNGGVGVERRQSDWFMSRNTDCRSKQTTFSFECKYIPLIEEDEVNEEQLDSDSDNNVEEEIERSLHVPEEAENIVNDENESPSSEQTTTALPLLVAENDDNLPEKVDTVLAFMFPSYRKKAKSI